MVVQQFVSGNEAMLIEANATLTRQLEAKEKRIRYLEFVLNQRFEETVKRFDPAKMAEMCRKCYVVFLEAGAGANFTATEFQSAFFNRWRFRSAHLPQRLRDLVKDGKLWRSKDEHGDVRFFLKLEEMPK